MGDKLKLIMVSVGLSLIAWLFWYLTGKNGFYLIGLVVVFSIIERIYKKVVKQGTKSDR